MSSSPNSDESKTRLPRKYTIRNQRQAWTTEEHNRFLEGIKLFKRDWSKVTAHVGTRTVVQIRSHAQKHFIKLKRQGRENLIPPRRNKDRREDENIRYGHGSISSKAGFRKRNSFDEEEKYGDDSRESKRRLAKKLKSVAPLSPAGSTLNTKLFKSDDGRRSPAPFTLDTNAGVQALLLLSQG
mmetsp:Transcript_165/g.269  ORF Transcript_165/g.269 Transcript_165/m.269 type:complete len:183 (-) Transcript_165:906-1454(-)|eukprot:CAMPEP_0185269572 /NCGR_PEP_ID=MMETSP1359-20130426/40208_1 /TAXON_ID=552665 /ORGANISM="Bigelowiella longifila, Strain CCMP242" /LENGTH=182 /DNA_ID=CAMNT_0027860795 /DNA_START=61 /DNA_END=609 /DNA_ORIENTATION=+